MLGLVACGDMEPPKDAATALHAGTGGHADPPVAGSDVSAVIGGWSARYGAARNDVQTALSALGSAQSADAVKKAAAAALTALQSADEVPPCPDEATEQAYRSAVDSLTATVTS